MQVNKTSLDFMVKLRLCLGGIMQLTDTREAAKALKLFKMEELEREEGEGK